MLTEIQKKDYAMEKETEVKQKIETKFSKYPYVTSVSDYIRQINKIREEYEKKRQEKFTLVYRGECEQYLTAGMPGLFRNDSYKINPFYERNLLYELSSNRIAKGEFLEEAFEAQHDEYPSRLLDVTYNALVALYFATTPYYKNHKSDSETDDKDGVVFIYFIKNIYSASSECINKTFDAIINQDENQFVFEEAFQENHKFVDHMKVNQRIAVQQGAFILFQGREYKEIPERKYQAIVIKNKSQIRDELNNLFGINTGFIYPEPYNLVSSITHKAKIAKNTNFSLENEIHRFMDNMKEEIECFFDSENIDNSGIKEVYLFEKQLREKKRVLSDLLNKIEMYEIDERKQEEISNLIKDEFNRNLSLFDINIQAYFAKEEIESSMENLRI